jgi:predicted extracellular nuclease
MKMLKYSKFIAVTVLAMCALTLISGQALASDKLLLTELVVTPTDGELIEIYNPTAGTVSLENVYVTDATFAGGGTYYYQIVQGGGGGGGFGDFHARFPVGATITAGEYQTIALAGSDAFTSFHGVAPTYELYEDGGAPDGIPDMREAFSGSINGQGGLTNGGEIVVLYEWDGLSDLVVDLDYALWGDKAEAVDKTGVCIDGPDGDTSTTCYLADTAIASQDLIDIDSHEVCFTWSRDDLTEGMETAAGGNGSGGHDETSEDLSNTWCEAAPSPNVASNSCGSVPIIINEVDADTSGTDTEEFIELYGEANYDLTGLVVVPFNGSDDASYDAWDLDGYSTDANGYFVIGNAAVSGVDLVVPSNAIQNGADAVALYIGDDTDFPNDTPVTTTNLIDAIVYDTDDSDDAGLLVLLKSGEPQVNEAENGLKDTESNQRVPNGFGCGRETSDYQQCAPTPDAENQCVSGCGEVTHFIHEVQGSGAASPIESFIVVVEGIVVGDYQGSDYQNGYYLQEEDADADGDSATSEGVFIYDPATVVDVNEGDKVKLRGEVDEYFGKTEIKNLECVEVIATGETLPTAVTVTLPYADAAYPERFEGMRVNITQDLTVSSVDELGHYGEVWHSNGRLLQPTQTVSPGAAATTQQDANNINYITLDDALADSWQDPIIYPAPQLSASNTLRAGWTSALGTGVVDYSFNAYRLYTESVPAWDDTPNPRPSALDPSDGLRVASFNLWNYCNGPTFPSCPGGPDDASEQGRQVDKLVAALDGMDADIVCLQEVETDGSGPASSIQELIDALNTASSRTYDFVGDGPEGSKTLGVAIIYDTDTVQETGSFATTSGGSFTRNFEPLAQTFREIATNEELTLVCNHFRSKSCDNCTGLDCDQGDGQACYNQTRRDGVSELNSWLSGNPTGNSDADILIAGDLNAYAEEDPITDLEALGYTDMVQDRLGNNQYSYVYHPYWSDIPPPPQSGTLDYILASSSAAAQVTDVTIWHINVDEPEVLDYNLENKAVGLYAPDPYRSSDHDPVIVDLDLAGAQAWECKADFDCDRDVDGTDASQFKNDFGRSVFLNPCTNQDQCRGDFDCDSDVDGTDASEFKNDFGRSPFLNPCDPQCTGVFDCSY